MPRRSKHEGMFTISELADEFDVSQRTIRFYEERGLICPQRTRGKHRIYSRSDRARLKLILRGKRFGYTLEEIAEMIGMTAVDMAEAEQIEKSLEYGDRKLAEIQSRIHDLKLMEQDLLAVRQKLVRRLKTLQTEDKLTPKEERA